MFKLKRAYIVNYCNVKVYICLVGLFIFVEVTSRCAQLLSNSQNLQIPFYLVLFIQGSMSRDRPNMIA
mgnify:CR=1 FL=1